MVIRIIIIIMTKGSKIREKTVEAIATDVVAVVAKIGVIAMVVVSVVLKAIKSRNRRVVRGAKAEELVTKFLLAV